MTTTTCQAPGCDDPHWGRKDYCRKHYDRIRRNGTLETKRPGPVPVHRTCCLSDCDQPHKGYGFCRTHLAAERRAGRLLDNLDICAYVGCGRPSHAHGLCSEHNRQHPKGRGLSPIREYVRQGPICQVPECPYPTQSKNFCTGHYARFISGQSVGGPLRSYLPKGGPCASEVCDREATVEGMCQTHRRRFLCGAPDWDALIPPRAPDGSGHVDKDGYRHITVDGRQVREHVFLMEQLLGRPPLREWRESSGRWHAVETVHHVQGAKSDNWTDGELSIDARGRLRSGNLELWSSSQPAGQEIGPKLEWAKQIIALYGEPGLREQFADYLPDEARRAYL